VADRYPFTFGMIKSHAVAVGMGRILLQDAVEQNARVMAKDHLSKLEAAGNTAVNGLHGSDSLETAKRELGYFFPDYQF
jgi:nucleoside diphosphate kinase